MQEVIQKAKAIRLLIFDVDGVLTDGSLFLGDDGQEYKAFNSRDGHGMKMLQASGIDIAIITGRESKVVTVRMQSLGIRHVHQGAHDKLAVYDELRAHIGLEHDQIAYVGDDVVDLPVMRKTGLAIAVQDAHPLLLKHAHWQTPSVGGRGAGRDVCEMLMQAQGTLDGMLAQY